MVTPPTWTTHPGHKSVQWSAAGAEFSCPVAPGTLDPAANSSVAEVQYVLDPFPSDLVYSHWDYDRFHYYWNQSGSTNLNYDFWYNDVVYANASVTAGAPPANNLLDFWPAHGGAVDWSAYSGLTVNFATNNSYLADTLQVNIYSGSTLVAPPQSFAITTNTSVNYHVNVAGSALKAVTQVDLVGIPNATHASADSQEVLLSSSGIALSDPALQVWAGVQYANGQSVNSTPLPRSYFGLFRPFDFSFNGTLNGAGVSATFFAGTAGAEVQLEDLSISNVYVANGTSGQGLAWHYDFDPSNRLLADINAFTSGSEALSPTWAAGPGVNATEAFDPYTMTRYTDTTFSGTFTRCERWVDYDHSGFNNGANDYYALDDTNSGTFNLVVTHQTTSSYYPDGAGGVITETKHAETTTRLLGTQLGLMAVTEEFDTYQKVQAGVALPAERVHTVSIAGQGDPQPFYIYEERNEWHANNGADNYELHIVSTWNATKGGYDVHMWNDYAATLNIAYLGESVQYQQGVTGVLDPGVTSVPLDPACPVAEQNVPGNILWICSYDPTNPVPDFYDVGLVLVTTAYAQSAGLAANLDDGATLAAVLNSGYRLCVGIILDLNRDHVWEQEFPGQWQPWVGASPSGFADVYSPLWEVSPAGNAIIRNMAHQQAWKDWLESNLRWQAIVQDIISIAVSVILTIAVSLAIGALLGGATLGAGLVLVAGFIGAVAAAMITQYVLQPYVFPLLYPQDVIKKQQRWQDNQNALMVQTAVPATDVVGRISTLGGAPLNWNGANLAPDAIYRWFKNQWQGYQVPVLGDFSGAWPSLTPEPGTTTSSGTAQYSVNGYVWLPELHAMNFNDPGDFIAVVWQYVMNPLGLVTLGATLQEATTPAQFSAFRYAALQDQRDVMERAYAQLLGCPAGVSVVIFPTRQNGEGMYVAALDDTRQTQGQSNFWDFSCLAVQVADQNLAAYAAKYQNYKTTDIQSTGASILKMVIEMVVQMKATALATAWCEAWATKFGYGITWDMLSQAEQTEVLAGVMKTYGALGYQNFLKNFLVQVFVQDGFVRSAGNALEAGIETAGGIGSTGTEGVLGKFGLTLGDVFEWASAFLQMAHNQREASRLQRAKQTIQDYIAEHPEEEPTLNDILTFLPQLATLVAEKCLEGGIFDHAKFVELASQNLKLTWKLQRKLSQVVYDEFVKQNVIEDAQIRKECKQYVKDIIVKDPSISARKVMTDLTNHIVQDCGYIPEGNVFDLRVKVRNIEQPVTFTADSAQTSGDFGTSIQPDSILDLPFLQFLNSPNIESISLVDPHKKNSLNIWRTTTPIFSTRTVSGFPVSSVDQLVSFLRSIGFDVQVQDISKWWQNPAFASDNMQLEVQPGQYARGETYATEVTQTTQFLETDQMLQFGSSTWATPSERTAGTRVPTKVDLATREFICQILGIDPNTYQFDTTLEHTGKAFYQQYGGLTPAEAQEGYVLLDRNLVEGLRQFGIQYVNDLLWLQQISTDSSGNVDPVKLQNNADQAARLARAGMNLGIFKAVNDLIGEEKAAGKGITDFTQFKPVLEKISNLAEALTQVAGANKLQSLIGTEETQVLTEHHVQWSEPESGGRYMSLDVCIVMLCAVAELKQRISSTQFVSSFFKDPNNFAVGTKPETSSCFSLEYVFQQLAFHADTGTEWIRDYYLGANDEVIQAFLKQAYNRRDEFKNVLQNYMHLELSPAQWEQARILLLCASDPTYDPDRDLNVQRDLFDPTTPESQSLIAEAQQNHVQIDGTFTLPPGTYGPGVYQEGLGTVTLESAVNEPVTLHLGGVVSLRLLSKAVADSLAAFVPESVGAWTEQAIFTYLNKK